MNSSIFIGYALAVLMLLLATYVVVFNWAVVFIGIRKLLRKTDERVPSGIFAVAAILALLAVGMPARLIPSSRIIFWWSISILVLDPYNWMFLYLPVFLLKETVKAKLSNSKTSDK